VSDVDKLMTEILGWRPNVKDKALRELVMARMKAGGEVRMGKGGLIKSLVKAIAKELPEAKASQKTQIRGTEPTYRKAYDILEREKPGGRTLDYGAGLGHGSKLMGAESFEPFPREGFRPTFIRPEDIPTEEFDRLVNLNVLNVMPREVRDATVENIGRVMRPGGMGIVTTRGRDVLNAAGEAGPEPMSKITSIGTYQKGFTPEELREYLEYILGRDYSVSKLGLGPAGATIKKKANGGAVLMKRGGKAKGETLASMDTGKVEMGRAPGAEKAERILAGAAEFIPGVAAGKSALEGEYQKALIEAGLDVAGGSLVKGAAALGGKAIPALAGIFIGEHARVWNKAAAKEFKKLEKAGVSNKDAFEKTGTFRSPDGELRQEISDRSSRLKGEKLRDINEALQLNVDAPQKAKLEKMHADIFDQMKSSGTNAPISELVYHPELFKAYPELESLRGRYNIIPSMPETGYYNLGSPTMPPKLSAEGPTAESARSSMLHEIQHAIQHLEGFGMGGNPEMGMTMLPRSMDPVDYLNQLRKSKINLLDEQARLAKEFKESGAQYTLDNPLVKKSIELPNKIDDVDQAIEGIVQGYFYPMYKRMAGEAESRAVQARRQMSPQQLQDVFPLSSYDVPIDQLIVKRQPYAEGGPVKMADGGGIGKNVGRGMAGLTRSRQPLDPKEIQAMFLDVPAGLDVPFAEAGAYALRGETDEAKESAAIDAALIGVPGAAVLAKPAYRAVKKGVQKAAPAVRKAARGALESSMESGLIQGPLYAVKPERVRAVKEAGKTGEILESRTAPATTPQGGTLLPRIQGMYPPDVPQVNLPRQKGVDKARAEGKKPKYTERMQSLLDSPTVRKKVDKLIAKGQDLGMQEWYGTEPLRQVALDVISPQQYESLMAQLASASQRNPVDQQNLMGSYLYYLQQQGKLDPKAVLLTNKLKEQGLEGISAPLIEFPEGYGSLAQSAIFERGKQIASGDIAGALPPEKKLGTFYRNLLGNLQPVTVDVNAVRGPVIEAGDPRWLTSKLVEKDEAGKVKNVYFPRQMVEEGEMSIREAKQRPGFWEAAPSGSEYAGFEDLWQRAARREGVAPAEAQALGWYGSADVTALKTKPELYVDNLERLLNRTAEVTGKSPLEVLRQFLKGEEFLKKAKGGSIDLEAEYRSGGAVLMKRGGSVGALPTKRK